MNFINILGLMAAFFSASGFIPQLIKIVNTKLTKDISFSMFSLFLAGVICWLIYGILINSMPIIISNVISMIMNITIIIYKLKYK